MIGRNRLGLLAVGGCALIATLIACVGDSGTNVNVSNDGGALTDGPQSANDSAADGGTVTDANTADQAASSDASDAGPVQCDPSKPFGTPVQVTELDTEGSNGSLRLMPDGKIGYFNADREAGVGSYDIYSTIRNDAGLFGAPSLLNNVNSPIEESSPTVSGDGLEMMLVLNPSTGGMGGLDIWFAGRASSTVDFSAPALLTSVNSNGTDNEPFLRQDGQVLYFTSDRLPTAGFQDLWRAARDADGGFDTPTHIPELASPADEQSPTVTPDDLVIYFSSERGGGKGGYDVYVATRTLPNVAFGAPTRVTEVNTMDNDHPSFISSDRCTLYLSRNNGTTSTIWVATKTP